ncbi:MAG: hypothetical protein FJ388_24005, partial [Verrucomicrobia bacterium]|nr:hypothetical protein [Verrucomicrobiota bacterium]
AGFVNRFIRAHAPRLSHRRYLADVAIIHSAWSEIASMNVFNPVMEKFVDEYSGWCDFLGETHRQWDVVLQQDLTAKNLARYPIVVLPSVMTLTDADLRELRRYVATGGRVVATGQTGTRYGPERYLAPREKGFPLAGLFEKSALPAPPHPAPLPLGGGEGTSSRSKPAAPSRADSGASTSLAPAEGERGGVRGQGAANDGTSTTSSRVRIVTDKPGVTYWRKDRDAAAARRMAELLDWPGFKPRIETDAPATVGVNLNLGTDKAGPLLTLDLNNCNLAVETDTLRPAPAITTTIRLPDEWRGHDLQASYVTPEMSADAPAIPLKDAVVVDREKGTLKLRTPSFNTCLIVYVTPRGANNDAQ